MRRSLVLAGIFAASWLLVGCNPPIKEASAPCNCHGTVETANPGAETPRFTPPPAGDEDQGGYTAPTSQHRYRTARHRTYRGYNSGSYGNNDSYRERRSYPHGYVGSDESYARYWSETRVAMSSYDYRSTSRVYSAGYSGSASYGYASGGSYGHSNYAGSGSHYEGDGWQDGYGRSHRGTRLSRGEFEARMDPWHGYDADCYNPNHHHSRHRRHY